MKLSKRLVVFLLVAVMLLTQAVVFADESIYEYSDEIPAVVFNLDDANPDGSAEFVFTHGRDLFLNLKDVLPGDLVAQRVTFINNSNRPINVYLSIRSPENEAFLAGMFVSVRVTLREDYALRDEPAYSEVERYTIMENMNPQGEALIELELSVSTALTNEFMNAVGRVQWVFVVEYDDETEPTPTPIEDPTPTPTEPTEPPVDPTPTTSPADPTPTQTPRPIVPTGDTFEPGTYIAIGTLCLVGVILCSVMLFRKKRQEGK